MEGSSSQKLLLALCLQTGGLSAVNYTSTESHVNNSKLVIGFLTRQTINKLLREGDISEYQYTTFFKAAKAFSLRAVEYLPKWCPLEDELLSNATWLDYEHRLQKNFDSIEFFVLKYKQIFPDMIIDRLNEQFLNYQLLTEDDIPKNIKDRMGISEENPHGRIDVLWEFLKGVKKPGTSCFEFNLLFKVAEAVMTIPHSNAKEERIFSLINKNKTPSRSSLKIDGTLSSLITVKTHIENPMQWKPGADPEFGKRGGTFLKNS